MQKAAPALERLFVSFVCFVVNFLKFSVIEECG